VARDGKDVAEHVRALGWSRAKEIGAAALRRVLREHTYPRRAVEVDRLLRRVAGAKRERSVA
jgi:spore maturation protein CgeB